MRQVRRKTADPAARPYLLKAKKEGITLSWNRFESMLPQDGFGRLGLACFDCLLGPCRINPFSRMEERTICGLDREELVLKGLYRFLSKHGELSETVKGMTFLEAEEAQKEAAAVSENEMKNFKRTQSLLNLAQRQAARLKAVSEDQRAAKGKREVAKEVGLGALKVDYVNICLEGVSSEVLDKAEGFVKELQEEAVSRGAKGFNVVLAGDLSPYYSFNTVSNQGGVEIALLTGLVDLYAVGKGGLGLGRNVASAYSTVLVDASEGKDEVKDWFIQAAVAYTKRETSKILASDQLQSAQVGVEFDLANLKAHLDQGTYKGICVLGGGSSVKVTEDELLRESAEKLATEGVLCLTYGNAGATLGKYGLLDGSSTVSCLGSENDVAEVFDFVQAVGADKVVALFPELSSARDLQIALNLGISGVAVLTSIKLPVDGSKGVAEELGRLIEYVEPKEIAAKALVKLGF